MLQSSTNMAPYIAHLILQLTVCMLLIFQLTSFNISPCKFQYGRFVLLHYCKVVECVVAFMRSIETIGLGESVVFNDLLNFLWTSWIGYKSTSFFIWTCFIFADTIIILHAVFFFVIFITRISCLMSLTIVLELHSPIVHLSLVS